MTCKLCNVPLIDAGERARLPGSRGEDPPVSTIGPRLNLFDLPLSVAWLTPQITVSEKLEEEGQIQPV